VQEGGEVIGYEGKCEREALLVLEGFEEGNDVGVFGGG
jgi:hypothetical protein